jgi:hypothetical protein
LGEYRLRSFSPWLASILLDVAMEDDVVQDLAHVVFIISKNFYNTQAYGHFAFFYARCVLVVAHCTYGGSILHAKPTKVSIEKKTEFVAR